MPSAAAKRNALYALGQRHKPSDVARTNAWCPCGKFLISERDWRLGTCASCRLKAAARATLQVVGACK